MRTIALDTETVCFGPARMAPPLVVTCFADERGPKLFHVLDGPAPVVDVLEQAAANRCRIVGQNIAYDMAVIMAQWPHLTPLVFAAYQADAITDTMTRQKLLDIAAGCYRGVMNPVTGQFTVHYYGLDALAKRHCGIELKKDCYWRTHYEELIGTPIDLWPEDAREYALDDGTATLAVCEAQDIFARDKSGFGSVVLCDEYRQARADLVLHLIATWGIRTDAEGVAMLRKSAEDTKAECSAMLLQHDLLRPNGSRNMKAAAERMRAVMTKKGREPQLTEKGGVCLDADACKASGDGVLIAYSTYAKAQNVLSRDVRHMEKGITLPLHTRFDSLMETGRTSSSGPNLQNQSRKKGTREVFVPRPGFVFCACDFDKAELHTLAQVCFKLFGYSRLRERLNGGFDPHLDLGAKLIRISYDEALARAKEPDIKEARRRAKPGSFGFPGGMGSRGFCIYARNAYGVEFSDAEAENLRSVWLDTWPEMNDYFKYIRQIVGEINSGTIRHLFSGRIRGDVPYTVACNSLFQGLAADGAKAAMFEVARRQYSVPSSALWGSRTVNFIHDELLVEVPADVERAHYAAFELRDVMVREFNKWVPDCPVSATPALMYRWSKSAEPVYDANGYLIPWK
jgi:DNA polymerase I-like protein with 3'-5' exonuclease and polymerase domains